MRRKINRVRGGFTITELGITIMTSVIVIAAVTVILVDSQRGWNTMYSRTYGDVVTSSYIARRLFDTEVRKASRERFSVDPDGNWIELYQYASSASTEVDRYVRFYEADGDLNFEYGSLDPLQTLRTSTVCSNVTDCTFIAAGRSAQMILTLDDGSQNVTIVSSAVLHNK